MKEGPVQRADPETSRCLAGVQDSIDKSYCLWKSFFAAKTYFPISYRVDGRVDSLSQLPQFA